MGTIEFKDNKRSPESRQSWSTDFCEPHLNLLAHAQALEIGIGSRCGGHGVCGGDKVRVWVRLDDVKPGLEALSPITDQEREHLSAEELDSGYRLACQCYPNRSDLKLRVDASVTP